MTSEVNYELHEDQVMYEGRGMSAEQVVVDLRCQKLMLQESGKMLGRVRGERNEAREELRIAEAQLQIASLVAHELFTEITDNHTRRILLTRHPWLQSKDREEILKFLRGLLSEEVRDGE